MHFDIIAIFKYDTFFLFSFNVYLRSNTEKYFFTVLCVLYVTFYAGARVCVTVQWQTSLTKFFMNECISYNIMKPSHVWFCQSVFVNRLIEPRPRSTNRREGPLHSHPPHWMRSEWGKNANRKSVILPGVSRIAITFATSVKHGFIRPIITVDFSVAEVAGWEYFRPIGALKILDCRKK